MLQGLIRIDTWYLDLLRATLLIGGVMMYDKAFKKHTKMIFSGWIMHENSQRIAENIYMKPIYTDSRL